MTPPPNIRRAFSVAFFVASALFRAIPAPAAELPLETLLAVPFPSELTASADGQSVAWIENASGVRNVWIAAAPAYEARRITSFSADDGIDLHTLTWSADGRRIAFVRGGDEGAGDGERTNPISDPAGRMQEVWVASLDARTPPRKLAAGGEPVFAPRGERLAFVTGGQIWIDSPPDAAHGKGKNQETTPVQVTHLRGQCGSLRWSPDGSKLAFVSARGTHAFVGVLDLAAKRVTWTDPAADADIEPAWSPDGKQLAFVRLPANTTRFAFVAKREGEPWSVLVADVETGGAREVFRADRDVGSVFQPTSSARQLVWTADDRLVFPWEKSGWLHLWSMPARGGTPVDLTPGSFEIEHITFTPGGREAIYSSNQGDLDGRKIWRVATNGGTPARLTASSGVFETLPVALAEGAVAFFESGPRQPLRGMLARSTGLTRPLRSDAVPAGYPAASLVEPLNVTFPSTDGRTIHGQLFLPAARASSVPAPAIVFVHGGPIRQMLAGFHYMGYYSKAYALNQVLASRGYAVLSVNFRSGIGYGLDFREADGVGEGGAAEFQDVLAAALYLKSRPEIDHECIGIWGGSYGGYLTAFALARASNVFKAGVDFHGVHDWNLEFPHPPFTREYRETGDRLDLAYRSSPLADIDRWRSPVLLITGDDDHNVPFIETVKLVEELRKRSIPFETLIFPDEVHDFLVHAHWLRAYRATLDFFERKLGR